MPRNQYIFNMFVYLLSVGMEYQTQYYLFSTIFEPRDILLYKLVYKMSRGFACFYPPINPSFLKISLNSISTFIPPKNIVHSPNASQHPKKQSRGIIEEGMLAVGIRKS